MPQPKTVTIKDMTPELWWAVKEAAAAERKGVAEFARILLKEALQARNGKSK